MLTTNKTSRTRLLAGTGALAVLVTAGLGLTASGTAAAAKVRTTVESATGVSLASLDQAMPAVAPVPPAAPAPDAAAAPVAPRAPAATPTTAPLPAPPVPPEAMADGDSDVTTTVSRDGKVTRTRTRVIVRRDGKAMAFDGHDMSPIPDMPQVTSADCKPNGKDGEMVKRYEKDGKKILIICSNRIRAAAKLGAETAANSKEIERHAYASALEGLHTARASIVASTEMGADARRQALEGVDTAIKEMEANLAHTK